MVQNHSGSRGSGWRRHHDERLSTPTSGEAFGRFQYPTPPLNRPGGAQGTLPAEVEREQEEIHLKLTAEAFEDSARAACRPVPGPAS